MVKYINFIEKITEQSSARRGGIDKKDLFFAKIKINPLYSEMVGDKSALNYEFSDDRFANIYPIHPGQGRQVTGITDLPGLRPTGNKPVCSLNWINTRNKFSRHILESLLDYQSKYWFSGKESDIKPLTFEKFLALYPFQYLDRSRLSRLISNLSVINPQNRIINLKSLFRSKKKYHAYIIKELVLMNRDDRSLKDKDIQGLLAQKGLRLSVRTVCNCRKMLHIPNYKEKSACYYGKDIIFSDYIPVASRLKKKFNKIPDGSGVYELSISSKIDYQNYNSAVIYIGSSKNLRKRVANYAGNKLKNIQLSNFTNNHNVFVRFYLTENHIVVEKNLLKGFKHLYGELPKANSLG